VSPRTGARWWPAAVVVALVAAALAWTWGLAGEQRQDRVILTLVTLLLGCLLLLVWALLFSRFRRRTRLGVLFGALVLSLLAWGTLRVRGVSGDLVPILEWRWTGGARVSAVPPAEAATASEVPAPGPGDYPQFLGPSRDGRLDARGLSRDWSATPPRLLWRRPVGEGWSAFAVAGRFAVTQEQRGGEEVVACYDLASGEPLWVHADEARFEHPLGGVGPRATPTIADGRVFALGATGILNALELDSGRRVWSRDVREDGEAPLPTYGFSGSPLVLERIVVVEVGGSRGRSLIAYDRASGEPAWSGGDDRAGYSSPLLAELAGASQILIFTDRHLAAHDPQDGHLLWETPWPGGTECVSQPVVLPGDRVFLSSGYGIGGKLYRIKPDEAGRLSVETLWESRGLKAKLSNVVYRDGFLYGLDDGILVCLDPADGSRRWKRGRYGHGQLLGVGDLLIVQAESGDVAMVEATPEEHRELGRFAALSGKTWNHPALAGRRLLVRNDREAAAFELP